MRTKIINSINNLDHWLNKNGWAGFDPYDLKSIPGILTLTRLGNKNLIFEAIREIVFELFNHYPRLSRKILRIEKQINAKAMGLFASAYLDYFKVSNKEKYRDKSLFCLEWLKENRAVGYPGFCWGYPFDWQSKELIPRGVPNGIVTTAAGEAFWNWYLFTKNDIYLRHCEKICEFLISLPYEKINDEQLCFSYTPLYQNHVHNLNLFVAEFLLKTGLEVNNTNWVSHAQKAINYTLSNQRPDGSFDYNGPPEPSQNFVDHYHTGFVLRMLHSIWKIDRDEKVFKKLERAFQYYITNFFKDNEIPKFKPDQLYRIDIHSCAESINCLCELAESFPQGLETAQNVAQWTMDNLQDKDGYYYYGILKSRFTGRSYTSRVEYVRWGQAWMFKALTNLLTKLS